MNKKLAGILSAALALTIPFAAACNGGGNGGGEWWSTTGELEKNGDEIVFNALNTISSPFFSSSPVVLHHSPPPLPPPLQAAAKGIVSASAALKIPANFLFILFSYLLIFYFTGVRRTTNPPFLIISKNSISSLVILAVLLSTFL